MNPIPQFDELAELAKHSPQEFEKLRQDTIDHVLVQASEHSERRLKGLQFQIEMERRRAISPMASCIRISQMMHESLAELTALLRQESQHSYCTPTPRRADVIPLKRPGSS
ncbi:MAG: DUF3135 domain-containing protein [Litorivicinus sp.]